MRRLALLRMAWLTLQRDRLGLALYAAVPIIFLSIFATVFQGFGRHGENRVRIAVLDLDRTGASSGWSRRPGPAAIASPSRCSRATIPNCSTRWSPRARFRRAC